jgi:hypothetical protein
MDTKRKIRKNLIFISFGLLCLVKLSWAQTEVPLDCSQIYQQSGSCPPETCLMTCKDRLLYDGCPLTCEARPCVEIPISKCPIDRCEVLEGCDKKKVCYNKINEPPQCGDIGYAGKKQCCEGFVKQCGFEFFDGTCDMVGENSKYSVPICLPCGNGICNQFEDKCNCPQDCDKTKKKEAEELPEQPLSSPQNPPKEP